MATRMKTVEYWFPQLATAADATDTNFTQITVTIPESSLTFRKVTFEVVYHDANTTLTGTCTRRQVSIQLGSAGYSAVNDTTTHTLSGENYVAAASGDFTSYFTTNWSGTSMTCDGRFLYDMTTGTPQGARNLSGKLTITYTYDDTSATHVKTVRIPLYSPTGNMATTQPGTAVATAPDLSTFLPEAGVSIKQVVTVVQGNTHGSTTDTSLSWAYDGTGGGTFTSGLYEHGGNQSMWFRLNQVESWDTSVSHGFFLWASTAIFSHVQAWNVVTYTFTTSGTSTVLNSLILPMEFNSPMGGPTSGDYQRATREFWIEEPDTITLTTSALFVHYEQAAAVTGMNARIGTGSFVTYSDTGGATCAGGFGLMIKDPGSSAISLARGLNTLQADIYNTGATNLGWNVSAWWMLNYTSGIASQGVGAHNHTVIRNLKTYGTGGATMQTIIAADAPDIPETEYFMNSVGAWYQYITNTTGNAAGVTVNVERLSAEGGVLWENVYTDVGHTDAESGIRQVMSTCRPVFFRWPTDPDDDRISFETSRRWRTALGNGATSFDHLDLLFTYHSITYTVAGTVSSYADADGAGLTVLIFRGTAAGHHDHVGTVTTTTGGAYTFTWYDNTVPMFAAVLEDATHTGASATAVAT